MGGGSWLLHGGPWLPVLREAGDVESRTTCESACFLLQVHRVFPSGLAAQEGTIHVGDQLLSINGQALQDVTHAAATAALRLARSLKLAVVVICKKASEVGGASEGEDAASAGESRLRDTQHEWTLPDLHVCCVAAEERGALVSIELEKGAGGVDFTLEGGKGSIHGDRPLLINRICEGGCTCRPPSGASSFPPEL